MSGPARAGGFVNAKDLERVARFYERLLGMTRLHATGELVVLQSPDIQLVVHAIPPPIAATFTFASPPEPREEQALKFFFTVPSLAAAAPVAAGLGGALLGGAWTGADFTAQNAMDPEGNIVQLREGGVR